MTTTSITTSTLAQAADAAAAANAQAAAAASSSGTTTTALTNPLVSLSQNFNDFLSLLTTQLQNQDPTSPMDTNQFTQELVQFTGVQQSVATNANLSQLISLTQGSDSLSVVGGTATVTSPQIVLQSGSGTISFNAPAAEPVAVSIVDATGAPIMDGTLSAQAGVNRWVWNGISSSNSQMADGAYGIALETGTTGADATAVPFSVIGTATGLTSASSGMQLDLGALVVPLSEVQSLTH